MAQISRTIIDVAFTLRQIIDALMGKLTFEENIFTWEVSIPDSGLADTEITVLHSLQFVPTGYIYNIDKAGIVYDSNRSSWTASQITVKCNVANAAITMRIY